MAAPIWILQPDAQGNCCDCSPTRIEPCDLCTTTNCACDLQPFNSFLVPIVYGSVALAQTAIVNATSNCVAYNLAKGFFIETYPIISFVANDPATNGIVVNSTNQRILRGTVPFNFYGASIGAAFSLCLEANSIISVKFDFIDDATLGSNTIIMQGFARCGIGGSIDQVAANVTAGATLSSSVNVGTEYLFLVEYAGQNSSTPGGSVSCKFTISCTQSIVVNPIIVSYNDGIHPANFLDACPKMLLPALSSSSGNWYADLVAAQAILNNALYVSNCIGFFEGGSRPDVYLTFTAIGGSSLSFTITKILGFELIPNCFASINALAGAVLTMTWNNYTYAGFGVYDNLGNPIQILGPISGGTVSLSPLPYTGRYTVIASLGSPGLGEDPHTGGTMSISSSSIMSVNSIQALYDIGLDCPGRLNCS